MANWFSQQARDNRKAARKAWRERGGLRYWRTDLLGLGFTAGHVYWLSEASWQGSATSGLLALACFIWPHAEALRLKGPGDTEATAKKQTELPEGGKVLEEKPPTRADGSPNP